MAAIAFSVELRDWHGFHLLVGGGEVLCHLELAGFGEAARTSAASMFRCCEERRKRSKASSGVILGRSIKIPLAWPMTSRDMQGLLQITAKALKGAAFINSPGRHRGLRGQDESNLLRSGR